MILPTKGISPDRSILGIGSDILEILSEPLSVSKLWSRYKDFRSRAGFTTTVSYEWFILSLDFLFMIGSISFNNRGRLVRHDVS